MACLRPPQLGGRVIYSVDEVSSGPGRMGLSLGDLTMVITFSHIALIQKKDLFIYTCVPSLLPSCTPCRLQRLTEVCWHIHTVLLLSSSNLYEVLWPQFTVLTSLPSEWQELQACVLKPGLRKYLDLWFCSSWRVGIAQISNWSCGYSEYPAVAVTVSGGVLTQKALPRICPSNPQPWGS